MAFLPKRFVSRGYALASRSSRPAIADLNTASAIHVGKYGVHLQELEAVGIAALERARAARQVIVIDEIGPTQLYSEKFKHAAIDALNGPCPLVGTVIFRP